MRSEVSRLKARAIPVVGGVSLLVVGGALMADQLGLTIPYRGIFLILLIPAGLTIIDGARIGGVWGWTNPQVMARLIAGVIFAAMAVLIAFGMDSGIILPALLMLIGAGSIVRALAGAITG